MHIQWIAAVIAALLLVGNTLPATQVPVNSQPTVATAAVTLTQTDAEAIALTQAGFAREEVTALRSVYEVDDGIPEWEVEFRVGDWEYSYTVHGETGAILEQDKDFEPLPVAPVQPETTRTLTKEEAAATALAHAGLTEDQVQRLHSKRDWEDGIPVFEVEFVSRGYEYDYEIHAQTGTILDFDREWDD